MVYFNDPASKEIRCPYCGASALYKYGRIKSGKQRYYCILCGRQFTQHARRIMLENRPLCPQCGEPMHIYKRGSDFTRFRCSNYLFCKTYSKIPTGKESLNELLHA